MYAESCCVPGRHSSDTARTGSHRTGSHRSRKAAQWGAPVLVLSLMPKCPMCVAAYLAMAGVGVSAGAAAWLREGAIALCIMVLGVLVLRTLQRCQRSRAVAVSPAFR